MNALSVIILVKSPRDIFQKTLDSVKYFDEVVIVNTGSDESLKPYIKNLSNVKVHKKDFIGFGPLKQFAQEVASNNWILSIDSDEVLSSGAFDTLLSMKLNPNSVYSFPFNNYLYGKFIKSCDWYPDRHIRLFNKETTGFSSDNLHEKILSKVLSTIALEDPIEHYSYEGAVDFLDKMQKYSTMFANSHEKRSKGLFLRAIFSGIFTFIKSYLFQKGILSGAEGFIISQYKSQVAFYKYLKCWEKYK